VPGLVRSSDAGTVLAGLHGPDEVRRGFRSLRETFGGRLARHTMAVTGPFFLAQQSGAAEFPDRAERAAWQPESR